MARAGDGKLRSEKRRAVRRLSKRVTQEEHTAFEDRAREAGFQNGQDYLSAFILGKDELARVEKRDLTLMLGQLGKIGSNLNQVARQLNSGKANGSGDRLLADLDTSLAALAALGDDIRATLK